MTTTSAAVSVACALVDIGKGGPTALAAVVVVDALGKILLYEHVEVQDVRDWCTEATGLTKQIWESRPASSVQDAQKRVAKLSYGRVLVGHCLWKDLAALQHTYPAVYTRDVALYQPFRLAMRPGSHIVPLQVLVFQFMSRKYGEQGENPVEKARAAMDLYRTASSAWEASISANQWPCTLPPNTYAKCYT